MKIAFNPSTVAALIAPPNNKDITFDLRGHNIFARGVKFCGTDTNTWRDIKINNVSIGSNILDLRDGSNTTLTNINGVVTINSTWRPVVDNLTSDSTTSSLSANQGRVLARLINTLSTNISNQYALRDGSNATGRWRGGLACLDVRDTNYTPYDLNMGLELHFFDNNTNNLKDGGEYNGVFSFRQWASGSDWSGGKAHQLSFTDNGNIWHRTSSGDDSWGTWKKLAYSTDIPSSLKSPYSLTTFGVVYDGSSAKTVTTSTFVSQLSEGTSTVTDGTMFITSWASDNGFADTNAVNVPYKRKAIHLWEYIKAKTDSLYATRGHNHDDRYLKLTGGTMSGTLSFSPTDASDAAPKIYSTVSDGLTSLNFEVSDDENDRFVFKINYWNDINNHANSERFIINWNNVISKAPITAPFFNGTSTSATKLQTPRKIWGQSFDGTGDVNGTIYINNNNSSEGAIRLNNNINSNARISAIDDQVIFNTGAPIRFGETSWDWNQWAGLKYTHSNKTIYLGIADGSIFNSNSAQSGGTLNLRAGIRNIDLNSGTSIRGLPTNGSPYSSRVTLNDTSISLSAYGGISMSTGPGAIELSSGYSGIKLSCQGNNASIDSEGFKVEASRGVYLNSGNSGNVYLCQGGNVGIGTTSPTYKLHVAGDIYTTTGFKKNGSSDSYVLLGGGGHKALSDFASSSHSHNYAANENYGGFTKSGRLPISGFYQSEESESGGNAPWSSWMHLINCQHSNINNNYALQIAASFFDNNTFKIRVTNDNVNNAWRDIIHSGNIGSQTVANAYHLYINSANTWSTWYWAGQSGQPSWLWGSNDGTNMYVWDPNNFNVHTAQYLRSLGNQNCQTGRTQNYGDVYTYNTYANNTGAPTDYTSVIGFGRGTAGTVEIAGGWCNSHLYWRSLRDCCEDWYSWRAVLDSSNYTEFINNYYWADVKISTSSSTTTSPTVSNLTATSSIRMGNILLEHTDEINNSTNGGIHLNYRNSGNITLCYGGGNVGIGTPSPTYKLDVNGQVRASGFRHSSVNSDNYMLLAGGGYKSFGGDSSHPVFLGYLNLDHGSDGTVSSSFYCLGYLVSFTYTRGGNYCRISIPDTSYQVFYIKAAIASVNYSGGGMDTWTGNRRGDGAWWLHCYASSSNEVRVKGFRLKDTNNDSWWGGNPLIPDSGGANRITVCIFGYVSFR